MLRRAWLLLCGLWAVLLIGINLMDGPPRVWGPVLLMAIAPLPLSILLRAAVRWVVWGNAGRTRARVYRP